jgi:polyphosphate kinase
VRFIFDKEIDAPLLAYLVKRLGLYKADNLIPGGRIHNFKDFINFPEAVFSHKNLRKKPAIKKCKQCYRGCAAAGCTA